MSVELDGLRKWIIGLLVAVAGFFSGRWIDYVETRVTHNEEVAIDHSIKLAVFEEILKNQTAIQNDQQKILNHIAKSEGLAK